MNVCIDKPLMTFQLNNPSYLKQCNGYLAVVELGEKNLRIESTSGVRNTQILHSVDEWKDKWTWVSPVIY